MKNISTGTGIALLAGAIVAYPILDRVMPRADASATHAAAVVAVATAQVEPTIVWYGITHNQGALTYNNFYHQPYSVIARAWSDGKVEVKKVCSGSTCGDSIGIGTGWVTISTENMGFNAASDINFDDKVDGADLGQLLTAWGDAPRHDIPPSDCPLNLINP
jgi:hypothetical protein